MKIRHQLLHRLTASFAVAMTGAAITLAPAGASAQPILGPVSGEGEYVDGPLLSLGEEKLDFGSISDIRKVRHVFKFKNTGTGMLTIKDIHASCGCTAAQLTVRDYLPGEEGQIEVSYDPTGRRGSQNKVVTITSNDVVSPIRKIQVLADVEPVIRLETPNLNLGDIIYRHGGSAETTLVSNRNKVEVGKLEIFGGNLNGEVVNVEHQTLEDGTPEHSIKLRFEVDDEAPMGWFSRQITLNTVINDDDGADLDYPVTFSVTGNVVGPIDVRPQRVAFGTPLPDTEFKRQIRLLSRTGTNFKILSAVVENGPVQFGQPVEMDVAHQAIETPGGEPTHEIVLSGRVPAEPGTFRGLIVITTDLEDQPEIKIPYFGHVRTPEPTQIAPEQRTKTNGAGGGVPVDH
ncbi:MAG: DUF1573 domain-containing protein [Phycisphaerales bacterium]